MTDELIDFESMTGGELAALALANGWEASKTSLFDEEAVEGWSWAKDSTESYCIADGDDPVADEPARSLIVSDLAAITELSPPSSEISGLSGSRSGPN